MQKIIHALLISLMLSAKTQATTENKIPKEFYSNRTEDGEFIKCIATHAGDTLSKTADKYLISQIREILGITLTSYKDTVNEFQYYFESITYYDLKELKFLTYKEFTNSGPKKMKADDFGKIIKHYKQTTAFKYLIRDSDGKVVVSEIAMQNLQNRIKDIYVIDIPKENEEENQPPSDLGNDVQPPLWKRPSIVIPVVLVVGCVGVFGKLRAQAHDKALKTGKRRKA